MAKRERYSIIKRLDKGGMAEVFLGKSASLEGFDKVVAIKRVLPDLARNERFVNMFLDEAKISLHLDHANIVSVFDVGRSGQSYFIVMEFIDGTNMKRLIEGHAMPLDLACYVAIEVCKALVYAHEKLDSNGQPQHIVHRDISPPNILISRDGEVKLTDFGLARAAAYLDFTDHGVVKGKFAYLSPEASMGEEVDLRADIFAMGVVLWESLAGRRLFQGQTDLETLQNVRACKVPPIHSVRHDIPASLDRILNRALAKNRADRYSSAREFGRELSRFLVQQGMSVTSYDLAAWIQERIDLPADVTRLSPSLVESAVQQELERFVGIKDDSKVVAGLVPERRGDARGNTAQFAFEDPRLWGLSDGEESDRSIAQRIEDSPSGLLRIDRPGTSKLGHPLSTDEINPDKPKRHTLPPRTRSAQSARTLPTRNRPKPPSLPPPLTSPAAQSAKPAPAKPSPTLPGRPAPKRTMMMTPIDEAFFDALDAPAPPPIPVPSASTTEPSSPRKPAPTAASASRPTIAAEIPTAPEVCRAPELAPPTPAQTPAETPPLADPPVQEHAQPSITEDKAPQDALVHDEATHDIAFPEDEAADEAPVQTQTLEKSKVSQKETREKTTPAAKAKSARPASAAHAKAPWFSQLVTLVAFAAVVYFSYLILAPALM